MVNIIKMKIREKRTMGKRADIATTLLVFMAIALTGATLFSFVYNSGRIEVKISDASFVENIYSKENLIEYYLREDSEKAAIKSYNQMINENLFTGFFESAEIIFNKFDEEKVNRDMKEKFEAFFKKEPLFKNNIIQDIKKGIILNKKKESFEVENEIFKLNVEGIEINELIRIKGKDNPLLSVFYFPKITIEVNLTELGLHSFKQVYQAVEECKNQENLGNCLSDKLFNFNVKIEEYKIAEEIYNKVSLTSKKKFLIDNSLKSIKMSFLVRKV